MRKGTLKLYNIADDQGEQHDLAPEHPERVADLKAKLVTWETAMDVAQYSGVQ